LFLEEAESALDRSDPNQALLICAQVLGLCPGHAQACFLAGEAYRMLRLLEEAEQRYRQALRQAGNFSPAWSALGAVLFDQLRFEEAAACQNRAIREHTGNPEAYYQRGLLRERRGDSAGASRDFRRAHRLHAESFPKPVPLDEASISAVLHEAIDSLHPTIATYLSNVSVQVREVPDTQVCLKYDPPAPPGEILGYFSGVSLPNKRLSSMQNLPGTLILFRRNLERIAWDKTRILDELRATVFAEVGDYLGLSGLDLQVPFSE